MRVTSEVKLYQFEFWSGAKETASHLSPSQMDIIENEIELLYPDGITETELNDIFWFNDDWIAEMLGYQDWNDLVQEELENGYKLGIA